MNESRRKEQLKAVTGSLYPRREKFRGSCWPHRSAQGPLLGAPRATEGGGSTDQWFYRFSCVDVDRALPERE